MKIAVFGGSFNPVHIGHLALADSVCKEAGYDKVIFVPTANPPHKEMAKGSASAEDRFSMVSSVSELDSRFIADDVELKRGGVSYTYDTLIELEQKYKSILTGKLGLVMGSDLLPAFHLWHRSEDIASMVDFVLAGRPKDYSSAGFDSSSNNISKAGYNNFDSVSAKEMENDRLNFKYPHFLLKNAFLDISSSQIRNYICNGMAWRYLVPEVVYRYILDKHLYGCN